LWIRDAALTQHQAQGLVQRLAADLAGGGLRLKGAVVNGAATYTLAGPESSAGRRGNNEMEEEKRQWR
jgi:hypothetical protein